MTLPARPPLLAPTSGPTTCLQQSHPEAGALTDPDRSVLAQVSEEGLGLAACMVGPACVVSPACVARLGGTSRSRAARGRAPHELLPFGLPYRGGYGV